MKAGNTQDNYNRMIQILPMIVHDYAKGIPYKEYAPFFTDFDEEDENPLTFAIKVEETGLPKFSDKDYYFQKFAVDQFPDTDLRDNLIDHLKAKFAIDKDKLEKKKKLEDAKRHVTEAANVKKEEEKEEKALSKS